MINLLIALLIPLLIAFGSLISFKKKITIGEFALQIAAPILVAILLVSCFTYREMSDTEDWNGQVNSRARVQVPCSHSYSCNCHEVSTGKTSSMVCDTCYEHPYDVDWNVYASTGEKLSIARIDRRGLLMPPRWAKVYPGEPFTSEHQYENYLLLNKGSVLFGGLGDVHKFASLIPAHPQVTDYYRMDHVLVTGGLMIDTRTWNWLLNEANKTLGTQKQANVLVVIARTADPAYVQALRTSWLGGKKNELIVVIGTLDAHKIEFADVISWTPRDDLKVELRDQINQIGSLDQRDAIVNAIKGQVGTKFERMHMKKYKYMLADVELSMGQLVTVFLICLLLEIGITVWAVRNGNDLDLDNPLHPRYHGDRELFRRRFDYDRSRNYDRNNI